MSIKNQNKFKSLFFGRPLSRYAIDHERLGLLGGLCLFGVDALSSVAYATEEMIIALGSIDLSYAWPIALAIVSLIWLVIASYAQTVKAYPEGGGAYVVAKNHLGSFWAVVAGSSLLVDYVLTVAVSVSAGVRSLCSAYPSLLPYHVMIAIGVILFLTWLNLRGIRESARALMVPILAFLGAMLLVASQSLTLPSSPLTALESAGAGWILLRTFAGGCTALTGIEAIANAGNALKKPQDHYAQKLLIVLGVLLSIIFLGITWIAVSLGFYSLPNENLISQIVAHFFGRGLFHEALQFLIACILFFAANTAFAAYPKLCSILARDQWMPKQLAALGDRLVFHNGIGALAVAALILVVAFQANTHHLIPLYAVGVFTAFTISQAGMTLYWKQHQNWIRCFLSALGACATFIALVITAESKFFEGAYLVLLALPFGIFIFYAIKNHYQRVEKALWVPTGFHGWPYAFSKIARRSVVVPISRLHKGTVEALAFAREMSSDVTALIIDMPYTDSGEIEKQIESLGWDIRIKILPSPYRSVIHPILRYMERQEKEKGVVLVMPEFILDRWWKEWLHNHTSKRIIAALTEKKRNTGQSCIIIEVPYYVKE